MNNLYCYSLQLLRNNIAFVEAIIKISVPSTRDCQLWDKYRTAYCTCLAFVIAQLRQVPCGRLLNAAYLAYGPVREQCRSRNSFRFLNTCRLYLKTLFDLLRPYTGMSWAFCDLGHLEHWDRTFTCPSPSIREIVDPCDSSEPDRDETLSQVEVQSPTPPLPGAFPNAWRKPRRTQGALRV